ncbi:uncharacterized protein LOC123557239 [Mercenaria mercenaria]|uniref:uncharacterized protein LOC123557239 n=1 Tax=Mercenaria mercenaria TaxID=6596 RepID=UPI00234F3E09|nr:uncharacterized protein LOC123557239 [Mercenaria mercenaria]
MSNQGESSEIDKVAEYLLNLKRDKKDDKKLEDAIKAHNSFMETFRRYKIFYCENNKSNVKQHQGQLEPRDSKDAPNVQIKLKKQIEDLKFEKETMRKQIDELKTRLSTLAGRKMVDNNPDIADLSDPFRPTQLAEKFREIYDEEWTHAFEELDMVSHDESKIIDVISGLIKEIEKFCSYTSTQQISAMEKSCTEEIVNPKVAIQKHQGSLKGKTPSEMNSSQMDTINKMIRDLRKSMGALSVRPLIQIFDEKWMKPMRQDKKLPSTSKDTDKFVEKAFEIIWLMKIQNPPMEFKWQIRDEKFDRERFTFYTKRGDKVGQTVWPAVLLHEDGPLMSKGIVQAK